MRIYTEELVDQAIKTLLDELDRQYFTDSSILPIILSNDQRQLENLQLIDSLHQSVLTSLQFGQYRRAVWYLQAFSMECENVFGKDNKGLLVQKLRRNMEI